MQKSLLLATAILLGLSSMAPAEDKPTSLFNGTDLTGWKTQGDKTKSKWVVGRTSTNPKDPGRLIVTPINPASDGGPGVRELINASTGVNLYTEKSFGDCVLEIEFVVPKGSNSGIYMMGEYEVQILDSYGKTKLASGDLGGIYSTAAPKVNASKKPGEWQKFVIEFQAPRFKDGKKVANARFPKVTLNGTVIHEDVEVKGPTGGSLTNKERETGPIMLQGDHGPVSFRNITIKPLGERK